ncbi:MULTISPECIES: penicillin-binding protein 1A [unclassified Burkholderia]|uniref:penicillin-binding protein 1A n=1 Tax=unclassified Burkholderia TaxID=2613784 RepID=UPI000F57E436|nr:MULTISPECIES: PBP1A family penicillin-binding protein [unclassified Burkholderia]RQR44957.1 PBP1A family penicillin-binding protein [Burkholderia sp. Bp9131]RQR77049.1 PBP1A family penicillin-binding protein [Burkholderia sp. Bp9015]RQR85717.1 PBP1A family penicillin-binding protein [Burkholderia sp. Bp9011]RQR95550.1 PBP1A family penicillin-binding protein [Burkholderia sp. Bp9010]RQS00930.1 PBP1A family penicillin-binding protein [Burkholderia sp. Bp8994]
MTDPTANPSPPPAPPSAPSRRRRAWRMLAGALLGLTLACAGIGAWTIHRIWTQLPSVEHLAAYRPALPLRIFSRDGDLLAEYGVERREFVPLERIPPLMRHALLAAEDAKFYQHGAIDVGGLARATFANVVTGQPGQGGSTITMQVARNFYLTRDKVLSRKLAEILMAIKLEREYGKDKLLELYMNQIYLGERAYGFAAAANVYFGKPLDALSAGEAAVLAGLPKAPSAFNPVVNPARATARRNYVLGRMHALGELDEATYREAVDLPIVLATTPPPGIVAAPYVAERARRMMVERFHDDAYTLGLDVTTTISMRDQRAAEAALGRTLRRQPGKRDVRNGLEGALVSLDAATGDMLALVGGADFGRNVFDHALQAYRQPGSSFKPFVYSAALEKGYFPGVLVDDTQRTLTHAETGARPWRPRNFGNRYEGFIPVRRGLVRSKNLVAVNLMQAADARYVQQHAVGFGFDARRNPASLPLALGAGAVTPLELASAYGVFANGGIRMVPRLILSVKQRHGSAMYEATTPEGTRVVSVRNAFVMDSMLRDVVRAGTARGALALRRDDTAGKTGTSNGSKDAWFAGYSSGIVAVAWLGYDTPRPMGRATGATLALPVWLDYMKTAVDGRTPVDATPPQDVALVDGDFVYAEYMRGTCTADMPPFIRSRFACGGAPASDAPDGRGMSGEPMPAAVDAAERERVLDLFRTED